MGKYAIIVGVLVLFLFIVTYNNKLNEKYASGEKDQTECENQANSHDIVRSQFNSVYMEKNISETLFTLLF